MSSESLRVNYFYSSGDSGFASDGEYVCLSIQWEAGEVVSQGGRVTRGCGGERGDGWGVQGGAERAD